MARVLPPLFEGVNDVDQNTAMRRFQRHAIEGGEEVLQRGKTARGLLCVSAGQLEVRVGDTVVGTAGPGDLVGEMALFEDGSRMATVIATEPSEILVLTRDSYEALRDTVHPVAQRIEAHTIALQVRRLRAVGDRIATFAAGTPLDTEPPGASFFAQISAQFGRGGLFSSDAVDTLHGLRKSPLFRDSPIQALEQVAAFFRDAVYGEGHLLCLEGEPGGKMYVLDDGQVDVIIATQNGPQHISTLEAGACFGMVSMASDQPRMATCVARTRVVVLELDGERWQKLIAHPYGAGSAFRRAMIHAFSEQLSYANAQLADFESQNKSADELMNATAGVHGYGTHLTP